MKQTLIVVALMISVPPAFGRPSPRPTAESDAVAKAKVAVDIYSGAQRVELPATNTSTGPHDFYSLFARLSAGSDAVYGIGVATGKKLLYADTQVAAEGHGSLKVDQRQQLRAAFGNKVDYIEATFTRELLEKSMRSGMKLRLTSSKGALQLSVPAWMFNALIEAADERDYHHKFQAAEAKRKQVEHERRKLYIEGHPELSDRIRDAILDGSIVLGMSTDEARASWGAPSHINKTVNAYGVSEQWVYGDTYVYFEHSKLTSWQSSQ
jgi:hypothetical protein